jgi:hypothetical protein
VSSRTYNDLLVDDVRALVVVQGDKVGENAHDNDGGNPHNDIEGGSNRLKPSAGVGSGSASHGENCGEL